jgi:AcrR family transcriptional regulator
VLEQTYQALTELVLARVRFLDHPLDRLRAVVDATIAFHRERPQLIGGLFQLWAMGGRDFQSVLERERRAVVAARDLLVADLRAGIANKQVRACDPERIVDLVLAVVDGVLVHHVVGIGRPEAVLEELADRIIEPLRIATKKPRPTPRKRA